MKKYFEKHTGSLAAVSGVLLCAVIVLGVYVLSDIKDDRLRSDSLEDLFETEMYNSADKLYSALNEGNVTTAYHYAKSAEECAKRAGENDEARLFTEVLSYLEAGRIPPEEMNGRIHEYLLTGDVPDMTVTAEMADNSTVDTAEDTEEPDAVSKYRFDAAYAAAARLIGVDGVFHLCEKNAEGELIFTCRNAYAVIDGGSGIPLEAALSLDRTEKSDVRITPEEGIVSASEFLERFYPRAAMLSMGVISIAPDERCGTYNIMFSLNGRNTLVSVKNDSGRVVRIVAR